MGLIKAALSTVGGALSDQWLEVIEADDMSDTTVFTSGVPVRQDSKRGSNKKGTEDYITDGSIIHVYPKQFMILVDGGKIVDYTAEEGYYKVDMSKNPSLFNGQFGEALKDTFERFKFGGVPSSKQKVFFINLQEIKGIKFGTRNPVNYFDNFYNSELFLRAHGSYSLKIVDPLLFYAEAIPRNASRVDINDINEQYLNEFLEALQAAINQMSANGERISHVTSKSMELSKYMSNILDENWKAMRGMEIQAVGLGSVSYDEESTKLINMRNQGAMLGDPSIREGYVQGSIARGMEAAGSNPSGSVAGFMGMGMGMQQGGGVVGAASQSNLQQMQMQPQPPQGGGQPQPPQSPQSQGVPPSFQSQAYQQNMQQNAQPMQPQQSVPPQGWENPPQQGQPMSNNQTPQYPTQTQTMQPEQNGNSMPPPTDPSIQQGFNPAQNQPQPPNTQQGYSNDPQYPGSTPEVVQPGQNDTAQQTIVPDQPMQEGESLIQEQPQNPENVSKDPSEQDQNPNDMDESQ